MSSSSWSWQIALVAWLTVALVGTAAAAEAGAPMQLSASQMDQVSAGGYAVGSGDGMAEGTLTQTLSTVASGTFWGAGYGATAAGRVTASAVSTSGADASATSTLSLTVLCH